MAEFNIHSSSGWDPLCWSTNLIHSRGQEEVCKTFQCQTLTSQKMRFIRLLRSPTPRLISLFSKNKPTFLAANFIASDVSHISHHMGRLSPDKRKLVRSLEKVVNKCIDRKCEGNHPTTDLLRERIYAALEGAVLGIEVDKIMHRHVSKAENSAKDDDRHVRWLLGFAITSTDGIH